MILASEALKSEQINIASGDAEAIFVRAQATAKGIDAVAKAIREGDRDAHGAIGLQVAEKYVDAFGKLAKEGTAVVVPGNVGDMGGMIASAMAVYGKVSEGQRKIAERVVKEGRIGDEMQGQGRGQQDGREAEEKRLQGKTDEVAKSVLQGFEETRKR